MARRRRRIERKRPPPHFLIVDTNCLWHDDRENVVSPGFTRFWETHSGEFPLKLALPETPFSIPGIRKKLRILRFNVYWSARVKADGRFHDMNIERVSLDDRSFAEPTAEDMSNYNVIENVAF